MSITTHTQATNSVLRALSAKENQRLLRHSEQVDLAYGDVLCEPGQPIRHVYFPNNAIISSLTPVDGHASVGFGLIGREGKNLSPLGELTFLRYGGDTDKG